MVIGVVAMPLVATSTASANGRIPGANELSFRPGVDDHLTLRATFGLLQSADGGRSWAWICEQAIQTNGMIADPPFTQLEGGAMVLLPPTGGILVSQQQGCSWTQPLASFEKQRGVDVTLDANDSKRALILMSTTASIDMDGYPSFDNVILETQDDAASWHVLATLPSDIEAETIEVAKSDPDRIYVSGTQSDSPRTGLILRSEDRGRSWNRATMALPPGTGSLLISAVHPKDADRLWLRVPVRDDSLGLFPARLYLSTDKGESARMLALTQSSMLGFALSPDGEQLAYGAPTDGLFLGASDGSTSFEKRSQVAVRCLRWRADGALYACGTEPSDPFSLGLSADRGATFAPLYALTDTCPASCPDGSAFSSVCRQAWDDTTRPLLKASVAMCSVPWAGEGPTDAGPRMAPRDTLTFPEAGPRDFVDGSLVEASADTSADKLRSPSDGCSIARTHRGSLSVLLALLLLLERERSARRMRRVSGSLRVLALATFAITDLLGCASAEPGAGETRGNTTDAGAADDEDRVPCTAQYPAVRAGLVGQSDDLRVRLISADLMPARQQVNNHWTVELSSAQGAPLARAKLLSARTYMQIHDHYGAPDPTVHERIEPGQFDLNELRFRMPGPWDILMNVVEDGQMRQVKLFVCVE